MRVSIDAALETGPLRSSYCYTGDILDKADRNILKYYVAMAKQLEKLAHIFLPSKTWLDCAALRRFRIGESTAR